MTPFKISTSTPEFLEIEEDKKGIVCRYRRFKRVLKTEVRFGFYLRPMLKLSGYGSMACFDDDFNSGIDIEIPNNVRDGSALSLSYTAYLNWEYGVYDDGEWGACLVEDAPPLVEKIPMFWEYAKPNRVSDLPEQHVLFSIKSSDYRYGNEYRFETVVRPVKSRSCPESVAQFFGDAKDIGFKIKHLPVSFGAGGNFGVRVEDKVWEIIDLIG